jgi:hypothetical protein
MCSMFMGASAFHQSIADWKTSDAVKRDRFTGNSALNQANGDWDNCIGCYVCINDGAHGSLNYVWCAHGSLNCTCVHNTSIPHHLLVPLFLSSTAHHHPHYLSLTFIPWLSPWEDYIPLFAT